VVIPNSGFKSFTLILGRSLLKLFRWKIDGSLPDRASYIICVAPHTSNWDFVIGYAAKMALGLDAHWLGKHTLFRGPMGPLMRAMGGIPIDRSAAHGVVAQVVEWFRRKPNLVLGVTPEGTRRKVDRWKTGFYHIARDAKVAIWPVAFDWGTRTVRLGPLFDVTDDEEADLTALQNFFRAARGRHPDNAFPPASN